MDCGTANFMMTRGFFPACLLWVTSSMSKHNLQKLDAALIRDNHLSALPVTPHSLKYLIQEKEYGSICAWTERDRSIL